MNFPGLIFLLIAHYLCGRSILKLFQVQITLVSEICLSLMVGVPVLSLVPCLLQLLHIPIILSSVNFGILALTIILCIPMLLDFKRPRFPRITLPYIYEWPFIIIFLILISVSVWRCFYYPPIARDMLSGPELLAEYTVREMTMINSVFTVDLQTTNNYFKSPFITGLQIIYKLLVSPFGQLWLSIISLSFIAWLYTLLRVRVHPLIAGVLLLSFITAPDIYAYTYLMLYDYSNMVFFFCGFYFLTCYFSGNNIRDFIFSAFLFGIATYIRTETLVLVAMLLPLPAFYYYRKRFPLIKSMLYLALFLLIPAAFYVLCMNVFVHNFIPVSLDLGKELNPHPGDISAFFFRLSDMTTKLIFSFAGIRVYGYFVFFFLLVLFVDLVWLRKFNREAILALYGIAVVYTGLAFLGYLLPLVDLTNTTKRGLFKMLPIMLFYMTNSPTLIFLSDKINKWADALK